MLGDNASLAHLSASASLIESRCSFVKVRLKAPSNIVETGEEEEEEEVATPIPADRPLTLTTRGCGERPAEEAEEEETTTALVAPFPPFASDLTICADSISGSLVSFPEVMAKSEVEILRGDTLPF